VYESRAQGNKEDDEEMKFGKLRTLRGQIEVQGLAGKKNIIVADGLINYGLKILSMKVWPEDSMTAAFQFEAILNLDVPAGLVNPNAGDNRQIAWDSQKNTVTSIVVNANPIIDPDHIVNRDLFLTMTRATNGTYNYLIEAQVVELDDNEAIITIIKETSQS